MPWTCDVCEGAIATAEDGWVEWIAYRGRVRPGRDLRLVHARPASPNRRGCQFDERQEYDADGGLVHDLSLPDFLGANGLMRLLALIAEESVDRPLVLEMIKRLHIPGYEDAWRHFDEAISDGVYEPNTEPGYPHQYQIQAVLDFYGPPDRLEVTPFRRPTRRS